MSRKISFWFLCIGLSFGAQSALAETHYNYNYAQSLYVNLMGRAGVAAEINSWASLLEVSAGRPNPLNQDEVRQAFLESSEFATRKQNVLTSYIFPLTKATPMQVNVASYWAATVPSVPAGEWFATNWQLGVTPAIILTTANETIVLPETAFEKGQFQTCLSQIQFYLASQMEKLTIDTFAPKTATTPMVATLVNSCLVQP